MLEVLFVMPGSQAGNGVSCRGSHLCWEGCNVLGMSELFKKALKDCNMVKYQLLAVKESKAADLLCYMVEKNCSQISVYKIS